MANEQNKRDVLKAEQAFKANGIFVQYFAREQDITPAHVKDLIKQLGIDRHKLEGAAKHLRQRF